MISSINEKGGCRSVVVVVIISVAVGMLSDNGATTGTDVTKGAEKPLVSTDTEEPDMVDPVRWPFKSSPLDFFFFSRLVNLPIFFGVIERKEKGGSEK